MRLVSYLTHRSVRRHIARYLAVAGAAMALSALVFHLLVPPFELGLSHFTHYAADENERLFVRDLNGDGADELISRRKNEIGNASLKLYHPDFTTIEQINYPDPPVVNSELFYSDLDADSLAEILIFTSRGDSVFLTSHEYSTGQRHIDRLFVVKAAKVNGQEDYYLPSGQAVDLDRDGRQELIFSFQGYYSDNPRKVFAYDPDERQLRSTAPLHSKFDIGEVGDLDGDGFPEILMTNHASANNRDSTVFLSDHYSWLIMLDRALNFHAPPVKGLGKNSRIECCTVGENGRTSILFIVREFGRGLAQKPFLFVLNENGQPVDSFPIPDGGRMTEPKLLKSGGEVYLMGDEQILRLERNPGFRMHYQMPKNYRNAGAVPLGQNDGLLFLLKNKFSNEYYLVDSESRRSTRIELPMPARWAEAVRHADGSLQLLVFAEGGYFIAGYIDNPVRSHLAAVLLVVFVLVSALYFGLSYLAVLLGKEKQRKELAMQLGSIDVQFDTHFVYNALTSISSFILTGEKYAAHDYITRFASLFRSTLEHLRDNNLVLGDEIALTTDYLELQKLRYREKLAYSIDLGPDIYQGVPVPKSIVYGFVQNAIKHCIGVAMPLQIDLRIAQEGSDTRISIRDNGPGFASGDPSGRFKAGGSLDLVQKYVDLFNRQGLGRASFELHDDGPGTGTRVDIVVSTVILGLYRQHRPGSPQPEPSDV
jgi:hypothetical protein